MTDSEGLKASINEEELALLNKAAEAMSALANARCEKEGWDRVEKWSIESPSDMAIWEYAWSVGVFHVAELIAAEDEDREQVREQFMDVVNDITRFREQL